MGSPVGRVQRAMLVKDTLEAVSEEGGHFS